MTTSTSSLRISILLLAAGEGSRLGLYPKALLKKGEETLLERIGRSISRFQLVEVVVVTGFYAVQIEAEIERVSKKYSLPLRIYRNPNPELGQSCSVRLGLESLKRDFDILLVLLSDQPEVGFDELQALVEQYKKRTAEQEVVLPMVENADGEHRGNPVLFSEKAVRTILANPGMVCRSYMDANPQVVLEFKTKNMAYLLDVDTPEDIQKLGLQKTELDLGD